MAGGWQRSVATSPGLNLPNGQRGVDLQRPVATPQRGVDLPLSVATSQRGVDLPLLRERSVDWEVNRLESRLQPVAWWNGFFVSWSACSAAGCKAGGTGAPPYGKSTRVPRVATSDCSYSAAPSGLPGGTTRVARVATDMWRCQAGKIRAALPTSLMRAIRRARDLRESRRCSAIRE